MFLNFKNRAAIVPSLLACALASVLITACATGEYAANEPVPASTSGGAIGSPGATLVVHGMGCPLCANNLDLELGALDGVTGVEIDLGSGEVGLAIEQGATVRRSVIEATVVDAGFTLKSIKADGQ